jgi:hypothetical protein
MLEAKGCGVVGVVTVSLVASTTKEFSREDWHNSFAAIAGCKDFGEHTLLTDRSGCARKRVLHYSRKPERRSRP